jgi:hypothetical protein
VVDVAPPPTFQTSEITANPLADADFEGSELMCPSSPIFSMFIRFFGTKRFLLVLWKLVWRIGLFFVLVIFGTVLRARFLALGIGLAISCVATGWRDGIITAGVWVLCFVPASLFLRSYHVTQKGGIAD